MFELTRDNRELIELLDSLLTNDHGTVQDLLSQTLTAHKLTIANRDSSEPLPIGPLTELVRQVNEMRYRIQELEHKLDAQGRQTGDYWHPATTTGGPLWTGGYTRTMGGTAVMAARTDDLGAFNLVDPDTGHTMTVKSK